MRSRSEALFVWAGGAAFIGSLAWCAYTYLVRWSPALELQPGWPASVLINTALLAIFAAHHSLFARSRMKTWLSRYVPDRLTRSVYVWVASVLLALVLAAWQRVGGSLYQVEPPLAYAHRAVQLAGVVLTALAVRAIDGLELAGIRQAAHGTTLSAAGPYGLVRHPVYLGWMLLVFAPAHLTGDRLLFAVVTSAYLIAAVPWEERSLEHAFGPAYARYKELVRWRIIPGLY